MKRTTFATTVSLIAFAQVALAETTETPHSKTQNGPNLLIIHTDEHNFRTLGCYREQMSPEQAFVWGKGNGVETPNIDSIAHGGAICTRFYATAPVCTPSRASFVTGLYPHATGAAKNGEHLRRDIPTFATILRDRGYATSYVGKWHLDGERSYTFDVAYNGGFEDNRFMMEGGHSPYFQVKGDKVVKGGLNGRQVAGLPQDEVVHMTDYFTDRTLEILERDKDKPFCLMLSIPDPHTPDYARPPYHTLYDHMDLQPPKTMSPEYAGAKPSWGKGGKNEAGPFDADAMRQYFGMVKHIDDSVGRILKFLDDNHLSNNTIVIFTSDHGDMCFEHNRRNKSVPYEASARIPFVIRHPESIPAGKTIREAFTTADFAPTILGLMGVKTDASFHGEDFSADFSSPEKTVVKNRITYYTQTGGWWVAAVDDRYKLILDKQEKPWLIDLEKDPDELTNVYNDPDYATVAKRMKDELFRQMKQFDEPGLAIKKPYITE